MQYIQFPMDVLVKIIFPNFDKSLCCLYEENKSNETIWGLLINTVPTYMPIDEILIVGLFLFLIQRLSGSICALQYHCHGLFKLKIYVQYRADSYGVSLV